MLGIGQMIYSNYDTGKWEIPTRFVTMLAAFYNTSSYYIPDMTNNPTPKG